MSHIYSSMEELIGGTPLLELKKIEKEFDTKVLIGDIDINDIGKA